MPLFMLAVDWWAFVVRGLLAIAFGLLAFFLPGLTLLGLVLLFGVYSIAEGVFNFAGAFTAGGGQSRWWAVLEGVVSIAAGVIAFIYPGLTALVLLYVIAAWALATGVLEIAAAIRLRRQIRGEWMLALAGVLSIVLGVLLFWRPGPGALALVWWIGGYAVVFGAVLIALGLWLRQRERGIERGPDVRHVVPGH